MKAGLPGGGAVGDGWARRPARERIVWLLTGFAAFVPYYLLAGVMLRAIASAAMTGLFYWRGDFATMWRAGFLVRAGDLGTLYHRPLFDAWVAEKFGGGPVDISWLYTPPMGLLALAVSALPYGPAFWAWRFGTLLLAAVLLRRAGLAWWVIGLGLAGPVAFYDALLGQNGALTGGLLAASLLTMETRPVFAGVLAGCLCIKPQLVILLPAVLARRRLWRPLLAAAATVAALAAASMAVEGWRSWLLFFTVAQPNADRILAIPFGEEFQMTGFTVFLLARSLHATLGQAWAVQGAASAAAFAACWLVWRRPEANNVARMAATVCLSVLAMPYGFAYDLVGFSVAMAALLPRAGAAGAPVLAALWLWPGFTSLVTTRSGIVLFPVAAAIGAVMAALQLRPVAPPESFDRADAIP